MTNRPEFSRRDVLRALVAGPASICLATARAALPNGYPQRPVNLVVPFAAGGMTDILGRQLGKSLQGAWHQPALIDNRVGAGGVIGADRVAKSAADGYTLLITTTAHVVNPSVTKKLPYDTLRDFAPIAMLARTPNVLLVNPALPVYNVQDLVAYARKKDGVSYGSSGTGGTTHLSGALLAARSEAPFIHVPYKGTALALTDLLGGQIDASFVDALSAVKYVTSGKLRAIGVSTKERNVALPDVPTIAEQGFPGFETEIWIGLYAPAGSPPALLGALNELAVQSMGESAFVAALKRQGTLNSTMNEPEFKIFVASEVRKWAEICRLANIKPE